jgi:uncharacterized membrane protein YeaQ/YmgE (transglycosylase-associated protein family)
MSSLVELPELVGFFSYSRQDDEHSEGALSRLRTRIQRELRLQLGRDFRLWQDTAAIPNGALWEDEIKRAIAESAFFIPIVTPSAVGSTHCRFEFEAFLERESALGRNDLVFRILYIRVPALEREELWRQDGLLKIIGARQYIDWQKFRHRDVASADVAEKIEHFCSNILEALRQPWLRPEERRHKEEAEARQRAEDERARLKAEAKRRAEDEEHQSKLEAEARERAEEERRRQETDAKRRADEEAGRRQAEAEARRAEDESRRQEAEARQRAEQQRAFAAAKRADTAAGIGKLLAATEQEQAFAAAKLTDTTAGIDEFLAAYPESHLAGRAQELKAMLLAREEAHRRAMASDDPAVLEAFVERYPKSAAAEQARRRLDRLAPPPVWLPSQRATLIGRLLAGVLAGAVVLWAAVMARSPAPSLVILLIVGLAAGWLAGQRGSGFGLVGDLIVGVVGAVMAGWLLPTLGIHIGFGIIGVIIDAVIGAVTLLLVLRLVRRA